MSLYGFDSSKNKIDIMRHIEISDGDFLDIEVGETVITNEVDLNSERGLNMMAVPNAIYLIEKFPVNGSNEIVESVTSVMDLQYYALSFTSTGLASMNGLLYLPTFFYIKRLADGSLSNRFVNKIRWRITRIS